ncbi:hypothetical protein K0U27_00715 [archaeon]|nr:hypothetical protein [archaeon]
MAIFGLDPIHATIVITVIGVLLQVGIGTLQSKTAFDARKLVSSAVIAVVVGLTVVATAIQAIPEGTDELSKFIIVAGIVASIAGIDQLVKNTGSAIIAKSRKQ